MIHFLHLKKNNPELLNEESKLRMENKTITSAENLLAAMEDILLWSKGQMQLFKPTLKNIALDDIFKSITIHFSNIEHIKISFENHQHLNILTDENYLKTIIRNILSNAIKALENTDDAKIDIKAWKVNEEDHISITDNGKGAELYQFDALFKDTEITSSLNGLGLHLIKDLAKAINCSVKVESNLNHGTTCKLKLG